MHDSGGLIKSRKVECNFDTGTFFPTFSFTYPLIGSFHIRSQSAPRNTAPRLDGKTISYKNNGTGRDSYIA